MRRVSDSADADFRRAVDACYMAHRHGSTFVGTQRWSKATTIMRCRELEEIFIDDKDNKDRSTVPALLRSKFSGLDWVSSSEQVVQEDDCVANKWEKFALDIRQGWQRRMRTCKRTWARGFLAASQRTLVSHVTNTPSASCHLRAFFQKYQTTQQNITSQHSTQVTAHNHTGYPTTTRIGTADCPDSSAVC